MTPDSPTHKHHGLTSPCSLTIYSNPRVQYTSIGWYWMLFLTDIYNNVKEIPRLKYPDSQQQH